VSKAETGKRPSSEAVDRQAAFRTALVAWHKAARRDLPWRQRTDAYAIWVAEVMLQQTQVRTVIPFYQRFLERFPDVEHLAAAPLDGVLKAWEGLGYYARARNLHRAARQLIAEHGGRLPTDRARLERLPGIGRYTAGAIASIAFGADEPVLDGNVTRVLCRVFGIEEDPRRAAGKAHLWHLAEALLPHPGAGCFNEALMDLGATVCTPRKPTCDACPVRDACEAFEQGRQMALPIRSPRRPIPHHDVVAGLVWDRPRGPEARLLITKRRPDDMLGGLWEFPGGKVESGETLDRALVRELQEELAIEVEVGAPFMTVKHAYTHFRITLHALHCRHIGGTPQAIACADWRFVAPHDLDQYAFPTADRRLIEALRTTDS
jgi:A/G-specific adenine glycosylase